MFSKNNRLFYNRMKCDEKFKENFFEWQSLYFHQNDVSMDTLSQISTQSVCEHAHRALKISKIFYSRESSDNWFGTN